MTRSNESLSELADELRAHVFATLDGEPGWSAQDAAAVAHAAEQAILAEFARQERFQCASCGGLMSHVPKTWATRVCESCHEAAVNAAYGDPGFSLSPAATSGNLTGGMR